MSESNTPNKTSYAIGIDLGTTFSCVGSMFNGNIEIITNADGERTTPSVVCFDENNNVVVGTAAKNMFGSDMSSVVFDAKRMIGRSYNDPKIQESLKRWPFKVVKYNHQARKEDDSNVDSNDNIAIKVTKDGVTHYYAPIEISARVLMYLKKAAEMKLGVTVDSAVVTVPAYFGEPQRDSTKAAATIAGFNPDRVRLLAEPTAAALAYGHVQTQSNAKYAIKEDVLVFDLGGGTFDVSVLDFEFNSVEGSLGIARATDGDTFLGGQDFDNLLINYCIAEFLKKNATVNEKDLKENSILRLRAECTRVKAVLSSSISSSIYVPCFHAVEDLVIPVTRTRFEMLCDDLFKRCMERVKGCLLQYKGVPRTEYSTDGSKLLLNQNLERTLEEAKNSIRKVILVGGSSRIPKIKSMLTDYFGAQKVIEPVNADEAVAYGAAYQAAAIYSDALAGGSSLLLIDCIPLDLSIETAGGVSTVLIERNSSIPISKTETFTTYQNNQTAVTINIFEGNRTMCADNKRIGSFNLDGIIPAPAGVPKIEVTFEVDHNGVLKVTAKDTQTGKNGWTEVANTQSRLSEEEIKRMTESAREHEKIDEEIKEKIGKKNTFEQTLHSVSSAMEKSNIPQEQKENVMNAVRDHEAWLAQINGTDFSLEELENRSNDLRTMMAESMKGSGMEGMDMGAAAGG
ncbi:heat shock protein 70 [Ordospora pajunii]|uniref:heat shock protein 70 n=1 Tax=Ordospora pajunii TaxID=3039483 RepID=UPI0029528DE2|nr:heat shock protein 70 [Ordospora pajunii]KAH9411805.1 heat shock protein 70 [Ordospora pajunii]